MTSINNDARGTSQGTDRTAARSFVEAAGRAVVRRGVRGLRVKDVAAEAGISAGLVSYYFPDLDDLLVDLHEHSVDRFYWSRMRLSKGPATPARGSTGWWPAACRTVPTTSSASPLRAAPACGPQTARTRR